MFNLIKLNYQHNQFGNF